MRSLSKKIKLSLSQRKLIRFNISRYLMLELLITRHHSIFESLEKKEIFYIDENMYAQFTDEARERLLNIGIDIEGNAVIKYLRLDSLFMERKKYFEEWEGFCRRTSSPVNKKQRMLREELSDKVFDKYENAINNSRCLFFILRDHVTRFIGRIKIPKEI